MPRPYDMPSINQSLDVITYANNIVDGWLCILFLVVAMVILIINFRMRQYKLSDCFMGASFITTILAALMWAMSLVGGNIITIFVILLIASTIWSVLDE